MLREITAPAEEILKGQNRPALKKKDVSPDVVVEIGGTIRSGSMQM